MDQNRLRELIEACRAGSRNWSNCALDEADAAVLQQALAADATLADELTRVRGWDAPLARAMDDVPVPAGLADRLMAAVQAEKAVLPSPPPTQSRFSRRVLWGVAASLAAMLVLGFISQLPLWPAPTADVVIAGSLETWQKLDDAPWQRETAPPAEYPFSSAVRMQAVAWRQIATPLDGRAVAYRLAGPRNAVLFVMQHSRAIGGLPTRPATVPHSSTQGICVGAWQTAGVVYVLVVEGSQPDFRAVLAAPPLAA